MNSAAIVRDAEEVGAARSHAKHTHSIANGSTSPHHRSTACDSRSLGCSVLLLGFARSDLGKKRRAHQQAIYNGCVLDYQSQFANRFILINLKFSCGTS